MGRSDYRLLSAPHEVYFCGFVSTTARLQQAGWQLSVSQDNYRGTLQLALKNKDFGGYMIADEVRYSGFRTMDPHEELRFVVRRVNADVLIHSCSIDFSQFSPIDAMPQICTTERKSIKDFNIFAPALVRTEEIIIEPQSVAECLDLIRKMQAPDLAALRERNRKRDLSEPMQQQNFHAQILSLAA